MQMKIDQQPSLLSWEGRRNDQRKDDSKIARYFL
jgi:hypothetical protein